MTGGLEACNSLGGYLDQPPAQRALTLGAVALAHAILLAVLLTQTGAVHALLPQPDPVRLLPQDTRPLPPPPRIVSRAPPPPDLLPVPTPDIAVAPPVSANAPRAIRRTTPSSAPAVSHFGAAGGEGGLDAGVATSSTGGGGARGSLGDFEAAVKRAILARKVQPSLAWDRRNTCVVNYTAHVARDGSLAGFQIDPCAVPEINEAARRAIRQAAPFPRPPDLGGRIYDVHGTLIFQP